MGIYIHLAISSAVTQNEWRAAYQETLKLVQAYALGELRQKEVAGIPVYCLTPTVERTESAAWRKNGTWTGWTANGDMNTLHTAEEYSLPYDLENELTYNQKENDAALSYAVYSLFHDNETSVPTGFHHLWGGKTQGEPYHMVLLAVGCLLADRLGRKAYVYGDITLGQCRKAVELANRVLDNPIKLPDFCDQLRWCQRVQQWPLTEAQQLKAFDKLYLGEKGAEFGTILRENFSPEGCRAYWQERFQSAGLKTGSFEESVQQYLLWGFNLRNLCDLAAYSAKDGENYGEPLIETIMDTGIYLSDKDCSDDLRIDQQAEAPYGVSTLLMQFLFAGVRNKYVDYYIPLQQVREELSAGLEGICDAKALIDQYLETKVNDKEPNLHSSFRTNILDRREKVQKELSQYDIFDCRQLLDYSSGNSIHPNIVAGLQQFVPHFHSLQTESLFNDLMSQPSTNRRQWLANKNRQFFMRDSDWKKIFEQIEKVPNSFARYYPMTRLRLNNDDAVEIMQSLMLNDELFEYFQTLPQTANKKEKY